jgi:hypothetical protein
VERYRFIGIITILIVLAIIALYRIQAAQSTPTVETQVVNEEEGMKSAVMGLYEGYRSCMEKPPEAAMGQVSSYCQSHSKYTPENFVSNLAKGGISAAGADPIICAQNIVQSTIVGSVNPSQQSAEVIESFGEDTKVKIKVTLIQEDKSWKVDNVICPIP